MDKAGVRSATRKKTGSAATADGFPIVGIGASAGGLEALEAFFAHVPEHSGMAYVVIQHLDTTRKSLMPELLQRVTPMPVLQAKERMRAEPDRIYVIPPNKDLSIRHGVFHLHQLELAHGLRLPIDFFFRSLAEDRCGLSIGVILSGMGSDGTLGLRAIKEKAGLALVQDPESAKFDAMPKSAIHAGLADMVAEPTALPRHLIGFIHHVQQGGVAYLHESEQQKDMLEEIMGQIQSRTSHDFSQYKKSTVYRRIERRMGLHQLVDLANYLRYLQNNPQEIDLLFKELLIGVTSFFRDPEAWAYLEQEVLPELLASHASGGEMRAWVVACSTGEEAYSLAMVFVEALERIKPQGKVRLQIFATDLDEDAIAIARAGVYPANIAVDVSPERLARFFIEEPGGYRVGKQIRDMVVFAAQNVIMDPPFTKLDMLCCRNLLIYLKAELQKEILPLLHYCLNPGGTLFLGTAETVGKYSALFDVLEGRFKIYRRSEQAVHASEVTFPSRTHRMPHTMPETEKPPGGEASLQELADQQLLQHIAPAAVLVNADGDVLYVNGRTGRYLEPAAGRANWNIYAMAREGLRQELVMMLPRALREMESLTQPGVLIQGDGDARSIKLTVQPIAQPEALRGMAMIAFQDMELPSSKRVTGGKRPSRDSRALISDLELALQKAHEEIKSNREEMQTQQEELKSSNEELQSTNEELQSTNEELTTSKEELQSLNEELQSINAELQSKVDDLSSVNSDMKNLLDSTDIATVFLSGSLHVRRFTTQATKIFKLIPGDVGRPLSDITTDLDYSELTQDVRQVLSSLVFSEKEIATRDGRWFRIKIMPYRTLENVIDGVVITFTDITASKKLESDLRQALALERSGEGT